MLIKLFPRDRVRLMRVKQMLDRDFTKPITIHDLIKLAELYESKLRKGFKQEFGLTIVDYITQKRLDYASDMLKNTDWQVQEIAYKAGYKDISTFNRAFLKRYNMTPTTWRTLSMT